MKASFVALLLFCLSIHALSEEYTMYLGGALVRNTLHDDHAFDGFLLDHRSTGFKIYGGRQFSQMINLELGAPFFGNFTAHHNDTVTIDNDFSALTLAMLGNLPLAGRFGVFAQAGLGAVYLFQTIKEKTNDSSRTESKADLGFMTVAGVGIQYTSLNFPMLTMRLAWEYYWLKVAVTTIRNEQRHQERFRMQIDNFYGGIVYNF